jgi:hypothetical protein
VATTVAWYQPTEQQQIQRDHERQQRRGPRYKRAQCRCDRYQTNEQRDLRDRVDKVLDGDPAGLANSGENAVLEDEDRPGHRAGDEPQRQLGAFTEEPKLRRPDVESREEDHAGHGRCAERDCVGARDEACRRSARGGQEPVERALEVDLSQVGEQCHR